jgi:hypothetical protein
MGGMRRGGTLALPEERTESPTVRLNPAETARLDRLRERLGARTRSDALRAVLGAWLASGGRPVVPERSRAEGVRQCVRFSPGELAQLAPAVAAAGSFAAAVQAALFWADGLTARKWRRAFGGSGSR